MGPANDDIDISPSALMAAVWELPSSPGEKLSPEEEESHVQGMALIKRMILAGADQSQPASFGEEAWRASSEETSGTSPIIIAAANDDVVCLEFLLSAPFANPNFVDQERDFALMAATRQGYSRCVAMLAAVCDPEMKDWAGRTPLVCAMLRGDQKSVAILAPITDLNALNADGETPRQVAERNEAARKFIPLLDSILEAPLLDAAIGAPASGQAARHGRGRSL